MVSCRFSQQHQSANPKKTVNATDFPGAKALRENSSATVRTPGDTEGCETGLAGNPWRFPAKSTGNIRKDMDIIYTLYKYNYPLMIWVYDSILVVHLDIHGLNMHRCFEFASVSVWFTTAGKTSLSCRKRMSTRWCPSSLANLVYKSNN